jgi:hypothetical protein
VNGLMLHLRQSASRVLSPVCPAAGEAGSIASAFCFLTAHCLYRTVSAELALLMDFV